MSAQTSIKERMIRIEIDGSELTPNQVRLIRSLNTMLALIKQAHFTENLKTVNNIPYAQQALEYSMDVLQEYVATSKVVTYDN